MNSWICEADLVDVIGKEATQALTSTWGGMRLYVPHIAIARHKIAMIIGMRAMEDLCAAHAGETLTLPNNRQKDTAKQRVAQLLKVGKSHSEIAYIAGITMRYVEQIAQGLRDEAARPQQGRLI